MGTDERLEHLRALAEHLKECASMAGAIPGLPPFDPSVVQDFCEEFQKLDSEIANRGHLPKDWMRVGNVRFSWNGSILEARRIEDEL